MAVYFTQKFGFIGIGELLSSIDKELTQVKGNGKKYFNRVYAKVNDVVETNLATLTSADVTAKEKIVIYEATKDIDPLAEYTIPNSNVNSTWRIVFHQNDKDRLSIYLGTAIQYPDSGTIAFLNQREAPKVAGQTYTGDAAINPKSVEPPGALNSVWTAYRSPSTATTSTFGKPDPSDLDQTWLNRNVTPDEIYQRAYPMSYMMSMSNRGLYLGVWEDSQEEIPQWKLYDPLSVDDADLVQGYGKSPFRWFVVQRAVDRITGHVRGGAPLRDDADPALETSRCPVFCVGGTTRPAQFYKFVVRELDVVSPSRKKPAVVDTEDSPAVLNPWPQNSISESGEFVVTFVNNLSTPRFRYADELDMVGTVGAEVIGGGSVISVNVYGEKYPRKYMAGYATNKFGTGMRVMVLAEANDEDEDSHVFKNETFSLSASTNSVNEGSSITFTANTTGVSNGKVLYYHIVNVDGVYGSTLTANDFVDGAIQGSFTIQNNTASITKTIKNDVTLEGAEVFRMVIRKLPNQVGNIIAQTGNITIADTST